MPIKILPDNVNDIAQALSLSDYFRNYLASLNDNLKNTVGIAINMDFKDLSVDFDEDEDSDETEGCAIFLDDLDDNDRKVIKELLYKLISRKAAQLKQQLLKAGIEIENESNHPLN